MAPNDDTTTTKSDGIQFPEGVTVEPFNPFAGAKYNLYSMYEIQVYQKLRNQFSKKQMNKNK